MKEFFDSEALRKYVRIDDIDFQDLYKYRKEARLTLISIYYHNKDRVMFPDVKLSEEAIEEILLRGIRYKILDIMSEGLEDNIAVHATDLVYELTEILENRNLNRKEIKSITKTINFLKRF